MELLSPERLREMTFLRSKKEGSQEAKGKVAPSIDIKKMILRSED